MVGDNLNSDVKGALDAGLDACWFNLRGRPADPAVTPTYTVHALDEIPALLGF
jgi:FMN phosphatase YigB (HAD superfamily)